MEPSDTEAIEEIALQERVDVSTKLFIEYHASIRGYDTICAAISAAMLAFLPLILAGLVYVFKEFDSLWWPFCLIIIGFTVQICSLYFSDIILALLGERQKNYYVMEMLLSKLSTQTK